MTSDSSSGLKFTLSGKKILLGITGSIAAYKAAMLTRLLIKQGAEVQVVMTPAATRFITPLTLSTLSKHPVHTDVISETGWNNHVELGLWADAMVIAPATASTLAKMASGLCDNMVMAVFLSARCPVFFAPAMDLDMWHHPTTQRNVRQLLADGHQLIPVEKGELASGLYGDGRMAEPETIVAALEHSLVNDKPLSGKKILITAGPTYEPIDPVRFIGNRSSGKMGIALADAAAAKGAEVTLVLGPTALRPVHAGIRVMTVHTAVEMHDAAVKVFPDSDVAILVAAVADFRPAAPSNQKIKKQGDAPMTLELVQNPDIAATLGQSKRANQLVVGFALETQDGLTNAAAKLQRKGLDLIVLNSTQDAGATFGVDTNKVTLLNKKGEVVHFGLKEKTKVAEDILEAISALLSL